ncbi:hypothetical protein [Tessaracoccus sp. Z1128]
MSGPVGRRATLPGASELFRPTREPVVVEPSRQTSPPEPAEEGAAPAASGRVKHDQKITVYFSDAELIALEDANLELRRAHGIRVDRGRIVRLAVSRAIADLTANGADSFLVSDLTDQ